MKYNSNDFIIRVANEDDIPEVMEVNLRTLPENYWYGFYKFVLDRWGDIFLIAELNGKIIGYIMNRIEDTRDPVLLGKENELSHNKEKKKSFDNIMSSLKNVFSESHKVGHVISIAVLPEYRKKGIGTALLKEAISRMKDNYNAESVYLEVRVSNNDAISLYKKMGFEEVRIIKEYYRDGEDAYVMVKIL
ncbi:ribosomal-protein-alanine acetyltransferase [Caldisphaera lagunensis DSM 15908]|uniref:Ribosomal-protein-alanine acetyltransferase n=1 Tax=Caldisphaera lagunensis (strain DSM 15908 / JCM 11604 / ANMR 0165 / IC-154) TaxID=1056495 RepID=L0AAU6_CALLD|nr:ribosomal protein S18-alanine N-acetyltransferase [Caldisphaera lagunensis]AFZ71038.1 ribosomal-protein-alanine acetyltransferase [Caldisphaera lagunensis DSM 15908]